MGVRSSSIATLILSLGMTTGAWATNGYFAHGISTAEKGLAGAGVAYSQDTLAAANNPAGMLSQGDRLDVGLGYFAPMREYSSEGGPAVPVGTPCGANCPFSIGNGDQSIDSENEEFWIPSFGYNWMIDDNRSLGVSVFGNGGLNSEYKGGVALFGPTGTQAEFVGTFGDGTAGVDLSQLFISTTYAARINEKWTWGLSGIIAYQRFEAKGLGSFAGFSTDPANLTNNDHEESTGFGVRVGVQGELAPGLHFGAAFQPEIDMEEFDDYAGLFADDGDFDIPSNWTVGLAVDLGQDRMFVVDVQRINYTDVDAVSNSFDKLLTGCSPGPTGGTGDGCLGGSDGGGFGWEDINIVKLGYQWRDENMTWRVGYSKGDQPIPSSEVLFNILAPGVIREHVTFGFTREMSPQSALNFAFMYAPANDVDGGNPLDPTQVIELEMYQYELVIGYSHLLD
ncbi:MAG: outer membrane protein transport protein [Gammaproteobacteria bacterium]|nr:outer membrane protein transport protein [Gammaproteobacteria bacterium]